MMDINPRELIEAYKNLEDILAVTVKISHGQVLRIVVDELIGKYKAAIERKDEKTQLIFMKVLLYYLTEDEINTEINKL